MTYLSRDIRIWHMSADRVQSGDLGAKIPLRERILLAGRELYLGSKDFLLDDITLSGISRKAGTSESGVVRLFGGKDGVYLAVYDDCWKEINQELQTRLPQTYTDPSEQLYNTLKIWWDLFEEKPDLMNFVARNRLMSNVGKSKHKSEVDPTEHFRYIRYLQELCQNIVDSGMAKPELDGNILTESILALSYGTSKISISRRRSQDPEQYPRRLNLETVSLVISHWVGGNFDRFQTNPKPDNDANI